MKKITNLLTNKYLLAGLFFIVWMLFFDQRDYFQQKERMAELQKLEAKKKYYQEQIEKAKKEFSQGVAFFTLMRNLTASGFYSSEMGHKDIDYQGNRPNSWEGVPEEVLKQYGLSY